MADLALLWREACAAIEAGERPVLVVVVEASGSVPGYPGTKMVVRPHGVAGTVGGGEAEHRLVQLARAGVERPRLEGFVHQEDADGTLCSGRQTFALLPLGEADRPALEALRETLRDGRSGVLRLSQEGLGFAPGEHAPARFAHAATAFEYVETLGDLDTLVIVGGGHVALALSRVMATLPFRIVVLDDRPGLETMAANRWADETRVIAYDDVAEHVPEGERTWVAIMTEGHRHDRDVLVRLVERDLRYLGMLGSAAKVHTLFSALERGGVPPERLAKVRSPIGVPIGSHSPEEIAISIAAEIVRIRNGRA